MAVSDSVPAFNAVRASINRQRARYVRGGTPTFALKRSEKLVRDIATADASSSTLHGRATSACINRSALPTFASASARHVRPDVDGRWEGVQQLRTTDVSSHPRVAQPCGARAPVPVSTCG